MYTADKQSYAPIAYGSKIFTPSHLKMSIYAKEFLAIYYALKEFVHVFWGMPKPTRTLTDNKSVKQFFHSTIIPPLLWIACDYMIQFSFIIADIPGTNQHSGTLNNLSRFEMDPKDKISPNESNNVAEI